MAKILSVIAHQDFQDKEYGDSKAALEAAGHKVVTASTTNTAHGKFGAEVEVDVMLADASSDDYDAIIFIGGPGSFEYFDDPTALNLAQDFYNAGKLTTAICAAPSILANAGLLEGVTVTGWSGGADNLKEKGANYTGGNVEVDGQIITGDGPMSATTFGEAIAENLKN
ncbi:DJ-1/PfpI family protein [Patescibacteria group bacterium]|nr:DJ-1/PfpI family protein [Patescibacteria group bacterium]MBU1683663.1 DJ-1/PfpI family protein [Patescibacteria group bacterium]MBU1935716.1 DJ-1/PfpI family protein [Patescibacteria group bacterium]